jgi:sRNA-binding regulator protein Hfq
MINTFNKFTLLVTSSKTQLIRSIIIPRWRTAHCFWSKYFENQARYEKVVKVFIYNFKSSFK